MKNEEFSESMGSSPYKLMVNGDPSRIALASASPSRSLPKSPRLIVPSSNTYFIYCDGASRKDGRGGWGISIRYNGTSRDICGGSYSTTSNRMEMTATIEALSEVTKLGGGERQQVNIYSDSQYVVYGITEYIHDWVARRWRTSANKVIANIDLWKQLLTLAKQHDIEWKWVKGHNGNLGNERADVLAGMGVPELKRKAS